MLIYIQDLSSALQARKKQAKSTFIFKEISKKKKRVTHVDMHIIYNDNYNTH